MYRRKKISDMTGREIKELIIDTVLEITDSDYGLELMTEIEESLKESIMEKEEGKGIALEETKKRVRD